MNSWQRWIKAPHTLLLRRILFQVHLWMGVGFGLYILVISVSGSAVVLRPQFSQWFVPSSVASTEGQALTGSTLETRVAEVYSEYEVVNLVTSTIPNRAVYVVLEQDGVQTSRFFDHYTGRDLGNTYPWQVASIEWLVDLHDDLLMGRTGRRINGIGGALFLLMVFSGLFIWWQGKRRWREGTTLKRSPGRSFMWQLHSFFGFWSFVLMFAWGITAVYFAFPAPFDFIINIFDDDLNDFERPEGLLLLLIDLHFGRFGGLWGRLTWVVLGLLPAVMFISGFILWWRRVVKKHLS